MSYVFAGLYAFEAAAADLTRLGSGLSAANRWAAGPTASVVAAAGDEVSAAIAALFAEQGRQYQAVSREVEAFELRLVRLLQGAAESYASAEATNADTMRQLEQAALNVINGPSQALTGRPLIGDGADGAPGTGQNGGDGGWLWGNGGNGGSGAAGANGGMGGSAG
ncbi:MAG: PE-PGRS family protein, partial [Mycobacterium sp.]